MRLKLFTLVLMGFAALLPTHAAAQDTASDYARPGWYVIVGGTFGFEDSNAIKVFEDESNFTVPAPGCPGDPSPVARDEIRPSPSITSERTENCGAQDEIRTDGRRLLPLAPSARRLRP